MGGARRCAGTALFAACIAVHWHLTGSACARAQLAPSGSPLEAPGHAPLRPCEAPAALGAAPVAFAALLLGSSPPWAGVLCADGAGRPSCLQRRLVPCPAVAPRARVHLQMAYGSPDRGRGARERERGDRRGGGAGGWGNFSPSGTGGRDGDGPGRRSERREWEDPPRRANGGRGGWNGADSVGAGYSRGGKGYAGGAGAGNDRGEATRSPRRGGGLHPGERQPGVRGRYRGSDEWPRDGGYRGERAGGARGYQARLAPGETFRVVDVAPSYAPTKRQTPQGTAGRPGAARGAADDDAGVRINKCFKDFTSRREADRLVQEGRVTVNGVVAAMGARVKPGDEVRLDGRPVDWEYLAVVDNNVQAEVQFRYIKYWKPRGVVCTTDQRVRNNIVDAVGFPERVFPVGRLDKDSTGLILLTSDGRLPNAVLRSGQRHDKRYLVTVDREIDARDIATLSEGVVISTPVQRDRVDRIVTARTLPCEINKVDRRTVEIVLQEGRNRQIRRMMDAVGYEVVALHRVGVMGLTLKGLGEGQWRPCSKDEMEIVRSCLEGAAASSGHDDSSGALLYRESEEEEED